LPLWLGRQFVDIANQQEAIGCSSDGAADWFAAEFRIGTGLGAKQASCFFRHKNAMGRMQCLDVPGQQVFSGACFAFNQGQTYSRADLLELFTNAAHGERS